MSKVINAVIIGLGKSTKGKGGAHSISYCHGWAYAATPGIKLAAACSRDQQNVADFIKEFPGCRGFQDYQRMLTEVKPDLVSVCAFAPDRETMVMAALECGAKAILIEKPFALTLAAAERMMKAAGKCGARLFVNHQRRYGKPFEWFRDAAGKVGEILNVEISQPFGNLLNFGPHLVDAALYALGQERRTAAVFGAVDWNKGEEWQGIGIESQLLGTAYFNDGVRLTVDAGDKQVPARQPVIRLNGSLGFAELHLEPAPDAQSVFRARYAGECGIFSPATNEHFHHSEDQALYMKRAAADICHAVNSGSATRLDASEAYRGLEIILGIYESARQRKLLTVPFTTETVPGL